MKLIKVGQEYDVLLPGGQRGRIKVIEVGTEKIAYARVGPVLQKDSIYKTFFKQLINKRYLQEVQ